MHKLILSVLFLSIIGCSTQQTTKPQQVYQTGQKVSYTLNDQHGTKHNLQSEVKYILLAFDMDLAKEVNKELSAKDPQFLREQHTHYIVDVSPMPGFVLTLFAGPKMRSYKFPILWAEDEEFKNLFPQKDKLLTLIKIDQNQYIQEISYQKDLSFFAEDVTESKAE